MEKIMIEVDIKGMALKFETNDRVFSPKSIDKGTLAMLSEAEFKNDDMVLDLGCGYGVVGILAAKIIGEDNVIMCDISKEAVILSERNAKLNGVENIIIYRSESLDEVREANFTMILSNPPYHADFSVAKSFIEKGYSRLETGGFMYMVTKRKEWYKKKFISVFGGVRIIEKDGYYIFISEKRKMTERKKTGLNKKHMTSRKIKRKKRRKIKE